MTIIQTLQYPDQAVTLPFHPLPPSTYARHRTSRLDASSPNSVARRSHENRLKYGFRGEIGFRLRNPIFIRRGAAGGMGDSVGDERRPQRPIEGRVRPGTPACL